MPQPGLSFLAPIEAQQKMDMLARSEPFQLAHQASLTRVHNAQAMQAEMQAEQERQFASMAKTVGGGTPMEQMTSLATKAAQTGNINFAMKAMQTASAIQAHEATTEAARARIENAQMRDRAVKAKLAGDLAAWVMTLPEDQRAGAWENGAVQAYESQMGQKIPDEFRKYSPTLMGAIQSQSMTAAQRMEAERKTAADAEKKRADDAKIKADEALARVRDARARLADTQKKRLEKEGGPKEKVLVPKLARTDVLAVMMNDPDLKGLPAESLAHAAVDIASEARALAIANRGMTEAEAMAKVIQRKKDSGDLEIPVEDKRNFWERHAPEALGGKPEPAGPKIPRYKPKRPAAATWLPREQYEKGKVYDTPAGRGRYIGDGQFEEE